ncbi:sensor histidine kinase [Niabella drilacis]|uniref:histidine kinase n=1 Tax=Niabella drilacis (strain DSM 25811 / CCM 8410 / CCUG 62505 / LMG 26954 / E90) TaxID=1285928 RepID=A0A1G6YS57_NIADE|nr:ATP-binding protein [Niabella drilacis]SDD93334.1 two-component system, OmpR family, phosphate regulon sensor histidine kinase PhoR [Niabella drilacis]
MFDPKNLSPRKLSFYTALGLATPISLIDYVFEQKWQPAVASFFVVLIGGYLLVSFVLERFIYRKIKVIYKFIYQTKATRRQETYYKYILPKKSLDEVAVDVENWAQENQQKVATLQANEEFRREFLQNLSHEFKTPVFAIQSYVETLLAGDMIDPVISRKFLEKTSTNVERLTNLLQDLDEISSLERGEITIVKRNFVIQDLLKDSFEGISIKAEQKNIHFSIKKGCEGPIMVNADKEKIRQVVINLLENAIKYGKINGSIKAGIYKTDDRRILVEISDDGVGIAEKSLPRIFERFFRTETGRSMDVTGSGLGLAICKHIIEAHQQTIHIRSTEGVGTTIGFTLAAKKD